MERRNRKKERPSPGCSWYSDQHQNRTALRVCVTDVTMVLSHRGSCGGGLLFIACLQVGTVGQFSARLPGDSKKRRRRCRLKALGHPTSHGGTDMFLSTGKQRRPRRSRRNRLRVLLSLRFREHFLQHKADLNGSWKEEEERLRKEQQRELAKQKAQEQAQRDRQAAQAEKEARGAKTYTQERKEATKHA